MTGRGGRARIGLLDWGRRSLARQLALSVSALLCVTLAFSFWLVIENARRAVASEVESALTFATVVVEAHLALTATLEPDAASRALSDLQLRLDGLRHLCGLGVAGEEPRCQSPEAAAPAWFAALLPVSEEAARVTVSGPAGTQPVVIQAGVAHELAEIWHEARGLLAFLLCFGLGALLLGTLQLRRMLQPVREIVDDLRGIASGRGRSPESRAEAPAELQPVVEEVRALTSALQGSEQENLRLAQRCLDVQEEERASLARELHDEVGQHLTALGSYLCCLVDAQMPRQSEAASAAQRHLRAVSATVHDLLGRLRPAAIDTVGLVAALDQLVVEWQAILPRTRIAFAASGSDERIDPRSAIHIYRICQEALTNVARHAAAAQVELDLALSGDGAFRLRVADDGQGFRPGEAPSKRFGLHGISERAKAIGAACSFDSAPGLGTRISVDRRATTVSEDGDTPVRGASTRGALSRWADSL